MYEQFLMFWDLISRFIADVFLYKSKEIEISRKKSITQK